MKIHIDIDCFFASAARIIEPSLEGKPIAIGGRSDTKIFDSNAKNQTVNFKNTGSFVPIFYKNYENKDDDIKNFIDKNGTIRGILTTSSYEARAFGVKTAMKISDALKLCPDLIIKAPNMSLYQDLSYQLHNYLYKHIPIVEQASIDEFYGDLSGWIDNKDLYNFLKFLQENIKKDLKLPVSIGAAWTKHIAKFSTNFAKPYGIKIMTKDKYFTHIKGLDIKEFPGIGKNMSYKLYNSGIFTLDDLLERKERVYSLGIYAKEIYKRVAGINDEELKTKKERKSIGISRTIEPLFDRKELKRRVQILVRHLSFAILKLNVMPTTYHLSLKYELNKKSYINKSDTTIFNENFFLKLCMQMLKEADIYKRLHVIRISISCSSFTKDSKKELNIINFEENLKKRKLSQSLYQARKKYGLDILKFANEINSN